MGLPNSDQILNQVFDSDDNTLQVDVKSAVTGGEPQAMGSDATGADTYATILTASADRQHLYVYNTGTHPAIISIDNGTSDHFFIPGQTALVFDDLLIDSGATVQAKNGMAGSNYTGLYCSIW